jgi:hypothetical protein
MKFKSNGLRLILFDDSTDLNLPLLDVGIKSVYVDAKDWSSALNLKATCSLYANYFNRNISNWEPVVEPWSCSLEVCLTDLSAYLYRRKYRD